MVLALVIYFFVFAEPVRGLCIPIILGGLLNLSYDLSFRPKKSFFKILFLFIIFAFAAYLNNPLTIAGCILTFIVVFLTTFSSYNLFGVSVYIPYLLSYFMLVSAHIRLEDLPVTILSLIIGVIFIISLNLIINHKKVYKLSIKNIDHLFNELYNGIDLKLEGKPVSIDDFNSIKGFYSGIYNNFDYKYFPNYAQQGVLNIVKALQYIGVLISIYDFTSEELKYIKKTLYNIEKANPFEIFDGINFKTKEMSIVLLNLEILSHEIVKDLNTDTIFPDRKIIWSLIIGGFKRNFSFKSAKFIFALKMAIILFVLELFTLVYNFPYTKWLIFVSISLMVPYIDDISYTAKTRIKGTLLGSLLFVFVLIFVKYMPIDTSTLITVISIICTLIIVFNLKNRLVVSCVSTIISIMSALIYISLPAAMLLKILWVVLGVVIVSVFNFLFLPYSVEKESKNNLKSYFDLNTESIRLIKEKVLAKKSYFNKTTILVLSNILQENIESSDENEKLFNIQITISDISNLILNYLDIHPPRESLKDNIVNLIDERSSDVDESLAIKDQIIIICLNHLIELYNEESILVKKLNLV